MKAVDTNDKALSPKGSNKFEGVNSTPSETTGYVTGRGCRMESL